MNRHSEYIRRLSDETGKSYRELETYWKIAEDTYRKLQMVNPSQYEHLRESGAESQEIENIFEKSILKLPDIREEASPEKAEEAVSDVAEEEFGSDIEEAFLPEESSPEEEISPEEDFSEFDIEPEPETTAEKLEKAERESSSEEESIESEVEGGDTSPIDEVFSKESDVDRTPEKR